MTTLVQHLHDARARLQSAGVAEAAATFDAELLARHVLGWDRATLLARRAEPAPDTFLPKFEEVIERRARREPAAFIIGSREFWNLELEVTRDVLIPRPESEFIVEEALAAVRHGGATGPRTILDVGTGSGCLGIALAGEFPAARVMAIDISAAALIVAQRNARRHGVGDRVTFVQGHLLDPVRGHVDLIVANPPYVRRPEAIALQIEVARFEPPVALYGGADGLELLRPLIVAAADRLTPGGALVLEFGFDQADDVAALVDRHAPLRLERFREDLQGLPRVAVIRRNA
jgi:release factor glutamine methyltransferase